MFGREFSWALATPHLKDILLSTVMHHLYAVPELEVLVVWTPLQGLGHPTFLAVVCA